MNRRSWERWLDSFSDNRKSKTCTELSRSIQNRKLVGIVALVVAFALGGAVAMAQQPKKVLRIGIYRRSIALLPARGHLEAFRLALRELGYIEGQNIAIEYRYAEEKRDRLPELAAELVRLKVDIIVVSGGPDAPGGEECDQDDSHRDGELRAILSRQVWLTVLPVPAATSPGSSSFSARAS